MMNSTFRVAIAGAGFVGRIHARSARLAGARLVGISASSAERARAAATELGAERAFASSEELVTAPDVDVVHICTPNHLHVPLTEAALAAGKHVICEKPLALDVAGAERLVLAESASRTVAAVPFVYRFYPLVRELRRRVQAGTPGALHLIHGTYLQDWLLLPGDHNWRVDAELGGRSRAFADIGSHWCDLVEFVTGHRIVQVCADVARAIPSRPTEDFVTMLFSTDRGARGSVVVSQVSAGRKNRLAIELSGQHETLVFDQEAPESAWIGRRDGDHVIRRDPGQLSPEATRYVVAPGGHPQGYADAFDGFVRDAYQAMHTGDVPNGLPRFADGLRAARIVQAVLRSAETRAWQEVHA